MSSKNSQSSIDLSSYISPPLIKGGRGDLSFPSATADKLQQESRCSSVVGAGLPAHLLGVIVLGVIVTALLFGCAPQKDMIKQNVVADLSAIKIPIYITARGVGSPSFDLQKIQEKRMSANRSSISAAVYQLISFLKGTKLEDGQIVGNVMETDIKFKESIENAVKELYEIVTQDFTTTETCISTIRVDKNKLEEKLKVKFNE